MNAPNCSAGACVATIAAVIIFHGFQMAVPQDIQTKLLATGSFSSVDIVDEQISTPSVGTLQNYAAALVFQSDQFRDPNTLGDNLAKYFDGGGRVVIAYGSILGKPYGPLGAFANGYLLIAQGSNPHPSDMLGAVHEPMSSLMAGVNSISSTMAFRSDGALLNGSVSVADWATGNPLVIRGTVKGRNRVDLNMFPFSHDAVNYGWSGDGAVLIRNALFF
jgi:hypothetical protein